MIRARIVLAGALWLTACQSGEDPERGARQVLDPAQDYQRAADPAAELLDTPTPKTGELEPLVINTTEVVEKRERDLDSELKAALGVPRDCVRDFVADRPTTIRISVSGIVRPTGMVIEPQAYGSGVSAAGLACIRQRVGIVVLKPLEETDVSKKATTMIEIDYVPPVIVEADPGVPEPRLRNVKEPLPKRPEVAPSGRPIQEPTSKWISGGEKTERPIQEPRSRKISGPKPRPIDGYDVDENAQDWR